MKSYGRAQSKQWGNINNQLNLTKVRGTDLADFLYLPSNITASKKADIIKKYGAEALKVDKNFENLAKGFAVYFEKILF